MDESIHSASNQSNSHSVTDPCINSECEVWCYKQH